MSHGAIGGTRVMFDPLDPEIRWHPIITNVAGYAEEIG
jgi:hypothetical protein